MRPPQHPFPQPQPPVKITHTGVVEVHDASNNNLLGYIAANLGNAGAQYVYDSSVANALIVTFQTDGGGSGTKLDISATVCSATTSILCSYLPVIRTRIQTGPSWVLSLGRGFKSVIWILPVSRHGSPLFYFGLTYPSHRYLYLAGVANRMTVSLGFLTTADLITQLQLALNLVTLRASAIRTLLALHGPLRLLWYVKRQSDSFIRLLTPYLQWSFNSGTGALVPQ